MIADWGRPDGVALRLLLVRHGRPEVSSHGRCYGKLDVGLSDEGRREVQCLSEGIARASIDGIWSSPRQRALDSATILAAGRELEPLVDARFGEIDFGEIEGMTYDAVRETYPELYERWMRQPTEVGFPGGESFASMRRRVLEAAGEILSRHHDETVAIVSHGGVNRILLADALGLESRDVFRLAQSYAGVSVIDYFEEVPVVRLLNGVMRC